MKLHEIIDTGLPLEYIDEVLIQLDNRTKNFFVLREGKQINGRFPGNIRIDLPTHLAGAQNVTGTVQAHAHVHGRKGEELGVLNLDGTASHGTRMKLHDKGAEALRKHNFQVPKNNLVE